MKTTGRFTLTVLAALTALATAHQPASASEAVVYDVYRPVDLGQEAEPPRDYFITLGIKGGVKKGSKVRVFRKVSTFDQLGKKLLVDVTFPIATLRVIHAEADTAIARLDKFLPESEMPSISPRAIMVGDSVKAGE